MVPLPRAEAKKDEAAEKRARLQALGEEETRLIKSINALRGSEQAARDALAAARMAFSDGEAVLRKRTDAITAEVIALEERRKKALEPIIEKERAVANAAAEANALLDKAGFRILDAQKAEKAAKDVRADAEKSVQEAKRAHLNLDAREQRVRDQEEKARIGQEETAAGRNALTEQTRIVMADLDAQRRDIATARKANEEYADRLDNERTAIAQDRRAIKSGYEALAAARKEILGRET